MYVFRVDESELAPYFPYRKVLDGLLELSKQLFNVEFKVNRFWFIKFLQINNSNHFVCFWKLKRADESHSDKMLSKTTEIYNVINENGAHISTLIIDPFVNYNHIWGYAGRSIYLTLLVLLLIFSKDHLIWIEKILKILIDSSETANMKPLAYLNLNARALGPSGSLGFNQVKKLFSEVRYRTIFKIRILSLSNLIILIVWWNHTDITDSDRVHWDLRSFHARDRRGQLEQSFVPTARLRAARHELDRFEAHATRAYR